MLGAVVSAVGRALAIVVLGVAGLVASWVALFRVGHPDVPIGTGKALTPGVTYHFPDRCVVGTNYCLAVRPEWTIPAAIAIGVVGVLAAAVIHRRREGVADLRAV